jgi:hypothetical protein
MSNRFETEKTIVVNMNLNGTLPFTPFQQEGPFYPVINFFDMGSDLTKPMIRNTTSVPPGTASATTSPGAESVMGRSFLLLAVSIWALL